jgi:hypothetical protein
MCAGLRDAVNLAWKLDLVLAGHAREELLDTYQDERLPSARAAIEFSMELGKVICVPDPVAAAARYEAMAAEVGDQPGPMPGLAAMTSGLIFPGSPHAGAHLPQGVDGDRPFDDVHPPGWRLIGVRSDGGSIGKEERRWFESIGGRVVEPGIPDVTLTRWFAEHHTTWALQRPDFYLYGTADSAGSATSLLAHLHSDLRGEARAGVTGECVDVH